MDAESVCGSVWRLYLRYPKLLLVAVSLFSVFTIAYSQSGASTSVTSALCQVYDTIRNVVFLLGITLAVLGGVVYAVSSMMPSSHKGSMQGYGMGMIIGGILGVVIAVAAPYILNLIVSSNPNSVLTATGASGVNGLCSSTSII